MAIIIIIKNLSTRARKERKKLSSFFLSHRPLCTSFFPSSLLVGKEGFCVKDTVRKKNWGYTRRNLADAPFECYFTELILPNNFWWLSRSPPCLHFPSKFEWSPFWILPKFSVIPPFGFPVTTDPLFCSLKNQVTPTPLPKSSVPPPRRYIMTSR